MSFSVTGIHDTTYSSSYYVYLLIHFFGSKFPRYYYFYLKTNVSFGI